MRLRQWESNLARCIADARKRKFSWAEHDCAKFVCEVIEALTGKDCYAEFRGKYQDRRSMVQTVREFRSLSGLAATVAKQFQLEPIPVSQARRGDVVLVNEGAFDSLAVVEGVYALGVAAHGLARVPRKHWKVAWKVG